MSWTDDERRRFEQGVIDALGDDGVPCEPVPGSLRVTLGGSVVAGAACIVTWAQHGVGKIGHHRATIGPADLGDILKRASSKLTGGDGAGG
jgi:hypothetical protein